MRRREFISGFSIKIFNNQWSDELIFDDLNSYKLHLNSLDVENFPYLLSHNPYWTDEENVFKS